MTSDILKQFQSLHYRRTLLEALAQLSCQLNGVGDGLAAVQQIIRPSQQFSPALRERLFREIGFYSTQDEQKLRANLLTLNSNLEKACALFLRIAKLDDTAFIRNFQSNHEQREKFKLLQKQLGSFQQQAQHYLAIRVVLQDRGHQLESVKLALAQGVLDQERLALELGEVRSREKLHKKRFRTELGSMLADTQLLISVAQNNGEVLAVLSENAQQLRAAIAILDAGGDIQLIPELIETIHCELLPETIFEKESPAPVQVTAEPQADVTEVPLKANNLFTRMNIWVSTSWNVTWAETKYYRR